MASRVIAAVEPLYLIAISPLLLFPTFRPNWTALALAGLVLVWLARGLLRRELWPVTPFNGALLLFCLTIPVAVWASAVPELTIPKLAGLILGLAAFRAVAFNVRNPRSLVLAFLIFAGIGLGMWTIGVLGMRLAPLAPLVERLPDALVSLPGAPGEGINPNQLAGVLALYLPFLLACIGGLLRRRFLLALLAAFIALAGAATLYLTRSRAGWIGLGAAALVLAFLLVWLRGSRRVARILLAGSALLLIAGVLLAVMYLPVLDSDDAAATLREQQMNATLQQLSLDSRVEIWSRAFYAMQDFPFTGVGLGAFRRVVHLLYPLFLVPPDMDIGHAHNIFLQVGVDVGLGGLVAYISLLVIGVSAAWETARRQSGLRRFLALGLLVALLGLHVYGLADALALGSKPGLALWMVLGLIAALVEEGKSGAGREVGG